MGSHCAGGIAACIFIGRSQLIVGGVRSGVKEVLPARMKLGMLHARASMVPITRSVALRCKLQEAHPSLRGHPKVDCVAWKMLTCTTSSDFLSALIDARGIRMRYYLVSSGRTYMQQTTRIPCVNQLCRIAEIIYSQYRSLQTTSKK